MRVYIFGGTQDRVVRPSVVAATRDFFAAAGVAGDKLAYVDTVPAGHAFIAPAYGNLCETNGSPYVGRCKVNGGAYDQPRAILQHIHGTLKPAAATLSATVTPFDQREFGGASTGLDDTGYVYVPASCRTATGACAVHVVFHGCQQGARLVAGSVYSSVGYNHWADSNRLIVLYPQVAPSKALPTNPQGCWDWWGYSGLNFQVRGGAQLSAVKKMVERLTAAP